MRISHFKTVFVLILILLPVLGGFVKPVKASFSDSWDFETTDQGFYSNLPISSTHAHAGTYSMDAHSDGIVGVPYYYDITTPSFEYGLMNLTFWVYPSSGGWNNNFYVMVRNSDNTTILGAKITSLPDSPYPVVVLPCGAYTNPLNSTGFTLTRNTWTKITMLGERIAEDQYDVSIYLNDSLEATYTGNYLSYPGYDSGYVAIQVSDTYGQAGGVWLDDLSVDLLDYSAPWTPPSGNVLTDPSFEGDLTWWSDGIGNPGTISTASPHYGTNDGLLDYSDAFRQGNMTFLGTRYDVENVTDFSFWYKSESGSSNCYVYLETDSETISQLLPTNVTAWTEYDFTPLLSGHTGRIEAVGAVHMDDNNVDFFLDDFYLSVPETTPYVPPTPGGSAYDYLIWLREYENGTVLSTPYSASIMLFNGTLLTETISADSTPFGTDSPIYYFTYPLGGGDFKTLFYPPLTIIPIIPGGANDTYLFTVRDLSGYLTGKTSVLEAYRTVGGHSVVISSSAFTSTINGIPLTLTRGQTYELKLYTSTLPSRFSFGYFYASGSPLTHTLVFNYFNFTGGNINQYLSANASRTPNFTEIDVQYQNGLIGYTFSANAILYLMNGTVVDTQSSTSDSDTFEFTGLGSTTNYYAVLSMTHSRWAGETFKKAWSFPGNQTYTNSLPDFTSLGWSGVTSNLVSSFLLLVISGIFSFVSAPLGILVVVIFAGVFTLTGLMAIPVATLSLAFSLAMIFIIGRRVQNS